MDYFITSTKGNDKKILSRHTSYEDALASGELAFKEAKHDEVISCIQAELDAQHQNPTWGHWILESE